MVRTQIYLSEEETTHLRRLAARTGRKKSELIRQAVDAMINSSLGKTRHSALRSARGLWSQRADLPDFARLRRELDREK